MMLKFYYSSSFFDFPQVSSKKVDLYESNEPVVFVLMNLRNKEMHLIIPTSGYCYEKNDTDLKIRFT